MPRAPSPKRYAQAVFEIALERNELEDWLGDLELLQQALQPEEFSVFLEAPQIPLEDKLRAIQEVLSSVTPLARNFISLLVSQGAVGFLPDIATHYHRFLDAHRGIERGEVVTVMPLSDDLQQKVSDILKSLVGLEVIFTRRVEPAIIGGLIAKVGDRIIDGSTRTRLEEMRKTVLLAAS